MGCADVAWWEPRGWVCAAFCALLTYCLFGTSGLGIQTVLFVSTALQNVCFPQKGIKVLFLRLACATRVVLQGSGLQAQASLCDVAA